MMAMVGAVCLLLAWALAPVLDGLALGEATARSLGLPLGAMRAALVVVLALATGAAVAQTGLIAFVGLAAPHLVRSAIKTTHARLILLSALMGGLLLMAADLLARWLIAPQELPVGVLTAVLGGSYLLWLMHRARRAVAWHEQPTQQHPGSRSAPRERHARRNRGAARHRSGVVVRPLDQHRRPERRGQVDAAQGTRGTAGAPGRGAALRRARRTRYRRASAPSASRGSARAARARAAPTT